MKNKNIILVFILLLIGFNFSYSQIDKANQLYRNYNAVEAFKLYQNVYKNTSANIKDRLDAGHNLSYISWKFYHNIEDARKYTDGSLQFKKDKSLLLNNLAMYEAYAENFTLAKEASLKAIEFAETENQKLDAYTNFADVVLKEAVYQINNKQSIDINLIKDAYERIEIVNNKEPGTIRSSEIQLGLALLLKDGKKAFKTWRDYFRITKENNATGILVEPEIKLKSVLLDWNSEDLNQQKRDQLIIALADSRFYQYADLMIKYLPNTRNEETNKIKDIIAYRGFCEKIENLTYETYRNIALGNKIPKSDINKKSKQIQIQLWDELHWPNKKTSFSTSNFRDELYKRFGTKILKGNINGFWCILGGHSVIDDERTVEQYGFSEKIKFISLDFMIANDFTGWYLGYYRVGGWAKKDAIIQVRSAYAKTPINMWKKLTDEKLHNEWLTEIKKESAKDDSLALLNPHAYLPGLAMRMRYMACKSILDSLKRMGIEDTDLRMSFLSSFEQIQINSSIFAHEGRHVIDKNKYIFLPKKLEFRAKISEMCFTTNPFLALTSGIYLSNIGLKTPHGQANQKIVINLVKWMELNKNEIKGFDPNKPTLPQLDLLSSAQLKHAAQSMEPFLKN